MRHADSNSNTHPSEVPSLETAGRAVPTFIATDLLEKLIVDQDAMAVTRIVSRLRRH